jgi:hypothetical protein
MGGNGTTSPGRTPAPNRAKLGFDRQTDEFTYVPRGLFCVLRHRWIAGDRLQGLERLIDPDTMEYVFISQPVGRAGRATFAT